MALTQGEKANFETMLSAARNGHLALLETTIAETGERVAMVAALAYDGKEYTVTPFGHMCPANPYEFYGDPTQDTERANGESA